MARVLLGVKEMNTDARAEKVKALLMSLEGVSNVDAKGDQQATVNYDEDIISVMDLIRALREKGLTAGME
jgi:copper chaperone CopZ